MLELAIKHEDDLYKLFHDVWFKEKYKYWNCSNYSSEYKVDKETWNKHEFVSIDKESRIIGYIAYNISRSDDCVSGISIISFSKNEIIFGFDLMKVICDIFFVFNFRKLEFSVIVGNPIEIKYDRAIKKYGGSICGYFHKSVKLIDNKYYDQKFYEIFREDFLKEVKHNERFKGKYKNDSENI